MLSGGRQQRAYLSLKAQGKIKVYFEEYVIRRFFDVGSQAGKTFVKSLPRSSESMY